MIRKVHRMRDNLPPTPLSFPWTGLLHGRRHKQREPGPWRPHPQYSTALFGSFRPQIISDHVAKLRVSVSVMHMSPQPIHGSPVIRADLKAEVLSLMRHLGAFIPALWADSCLWTCVHNSPLTLDCEDILFDCYITNEPGHSQHPISGGNTSTSGLQMPLLHNWKPKSAFCMSGNAPNCTYSPTSDWIIVDSYIMAVSFQL